MALYPWWYSQPEAWDTCILGPYTLGGRPTASGAAYGYCVVTPERAKKLDKKRAPGKHGSTITDQGYEPATVSVELNIIDELAWNALQAMLPMLEPPATKTASPPFGISHPAVNLRNITSVIIEKIKGPIKGSVPGLYTVTFTCVEFTSPTAATKKSVTKTPTAALPPFANKTFGSSASPPSSSTPPKP